MAKIWIAFTALLIWQLGKVRAENQGRCILINEQAENVPDEEWLFGHTLGREMNDDDVAGTVVYTFDAVDINSVTPGVPNSPSDQPYVTFVLDPNKNKMTVEVTTNIATYESFETSAANLVIPVEFNCVGGYSSIYFTVRVKFSNTFPPVFDAATEDELTLPMPYPNNFLVTTVIVTDIDLGSKTVTLGLDAVGDDLFTVSTPRVVGKEYHFDLKTKKQLNLEVLTEVQATVTTTQAGVSLNDVAMLSFMPDVAASTPPDPRFSDSVYIAELNPNHPVGTEIPVPGVTFVEGYDSEKLSVIIEDVINADKNLFSVELEGNAVKLMLTSALPTDISDQSHIVVKLEATHESAHATGRTIILLELPKVLTTTPAPGTTTECAVVTCPPCVTTTLETTECPLCPTSEAPTECPIATCEPYTTTQATTTVSMTPTECPEATTCPPVECTCEPCTSPGTGTTTAGTGTTPAECPTTSAPTECPVNCPTTAAPTECPITCEPCTTTPGTGTECPVCPTTVAPTECPIICPTTVAPTECPIICPTTPDPTECPITCEPCATTPGTGTECPVTCPTTLAPTECPIICPTTVAPTECPIICPTTVAPTECPIICPTTPDPTECPITCEPCATTPGTGTECPIICPTTVAPTECPIVCPTTPAPTTCPTTTAPTECPITCEPCATTPDPGSGSIEFRPESYEATIEPFYNGLVLTVYAVADPVQTVKYSIVSDNDMVNQKVRVQDDGGIYANSLEPGVVNFNVVATVPGTSLTASAKVKIFVRSITTCGDDILFAYSLVVTSVMEGVGEVVVPGEDTTVPASGCVYSLVEGGDYFTINDATGELSSVANALDREDPIFNGVETPYVKATMRVECSGRRGALATDVGSSRAAGDYAWSVVSSKTDMVVTVVIDDANDNTPVFQHTSPLVVGYPGVLLTPELNPASLVTVQATDADIGLNAQIQYSLIESGDYEMFHIHPTTGTVYVASSEVVMSDEDRVVSVQAVDRAGNGLTTELVIQVKIISLRDITEIFIADMLLEDVERVVNSLSAKTSTTVNTLDASVRPVFEMRGARLNANQTRLRLVIYAVDSTGHIVLASDFISQLDNVELDFDVDDITQLQSIITFPTIDTSGLEGAVIALGVVCGLLIVSGCVAFYFFYVRPRMKSRSETKDLLSPHYDDTNSSISGKETQDDTKVGVESWMRGADNESMDPEDESMKKSPSSVDLQGVTVDDRTQTLTEFVMPVDEVYTSTTDDPRVPHTDYELPRTTGIDLDAEEEYDEEEERRKARIAERKRSMVTFNESVDCIEIESERA